MSTGAEAVPDGSKLAVPGTGSKLRVPQEMNNGKGSPFGKQEFESRSLEARGYTTWSQVILGCFQSLLGQDAFQQMVIWGDNSSNPGKKGGREGKGVLAPARRITDQGRAQSLKGRLDRCHGPELEQTQEEAGFNLKGWSMATKATGLPWLPRNQPYWGRV